MKLETRQGLDQEGHASKKYEIYLLAMGHKLRNEMIRSAVKKYSSGCRMKRGLRAQDWRQRNKALDSYDRPSGDKALMGPKWK